MTKRQRYIDLYFGITKLQHHVQQINKIKKMYFIKRKLNGATVDQMLLKWNKCETEHDKQENSGTDNTL